MAKVLKWIGIVFGVLIVALVLLAAFFDWNMLRGPIARFASEKAGRTVRLDGPLRVHLFSWTPSVEVNGFKISNPPWAGKEQMADVQRFTVAVKLLPLFKGDVILPLVDIRKPTVYLVREKSGRANWDLGKKEKPKDNAKPTKLPAIRHFVIEDGHITVKDEQRKLMFAGLVESHETAGGGQGDQGFRFEGKGALNEKPFLLKASGGPLINLDPDKPYPFKLDVRAGETHVTADGAIPKPFDMGQFHTQLTVSGDDLADMYYLSGLALPNTPPYRLSGRLERDGTTFAFRKFAGKVGDSDLEGDMRVDAATGRPKVNADLTSKLLDFNDLGSLVGAPPSTKPGETASPKQKAQAARMAAQERLLPDAPLQVERVRGMDAQLKYRAVSIKVPNLPLKQVVLDLTLDHGVLTMHPLSFTMPQGDLLADIRLDARKDVPQTDLDVRLKDIRLEELTGKSNPNPPIEGTLQARAKLHTVGNSVHKAASSADGTVTVVIPKGEIRAAFAQLIGVNAAKGLGLLLSGDQSKTDLRCAVVNMPAKDGVLDVQTMVFDTDPTLVTGKGEIHLESETLDLTIEGHPKHFTITHVMAPVSIGGHLRKPAIGIKPAKPAAQAAAAVALGVVLTPLAAILPFVDPGLAKDANCSALMAQAHQTGTQTNTAPPGQHSAPAPKKR